MKKIGFCLLVLACFFGGTTVCHAESKTQDGIIYNVINPQNDDPANDVIKITGYEGTDPILKIPLRIETGGRELPVKIIGGGAFKDNHVIEQVVFPYQMSQEDYVEIIYAYAFENCVNLTSIDIPVTVNHIDNNAFAGCTSLKTADLSSKVDYLYGTFSGCTALTSVTLSSPLTSISNGVFEDCESLESITIPASVNDISTSAFEGCTSLERVDVVSGNLTYTSDHGILYTQGKGELIRFPQAKQLSDYTVPDTVTKIQYYSLDECRYLQTIAIPASVVHLYDDTGRLFMGSHQLESISVDENNPNFSSDSAGVLYNKDKTTLLRYPQNKIHGNFFTSYTVLNSVTTLEDCAFAENRNLEHVVLQSKLTSVKNKVFAASVKLKSIEVQSSEAQNDPIGIFDEDVEANYPSNLVVKGIAGSYAQRFAQENGFAFVELGNNTAPTVANAIPDQTATYAKGFLYQIPENTFADAENDTLTYTMSATDSAITFNENTRTVSYTPRSEDAVDVTITASDSAGEQVSDTFQITVIKPPIFTTMSVTNITKNSAKVIFSLDEDCTYRIAATLSTTPYAPVIWEPQVRPSITGTASANEAVEYTMTQVVGEDNFNVGTEYILYVRVGDSDNNWVNHSVTFTTMKHSSDKPDAPTLQSKTDDSITLNEVNGLEYSIDNGDTWQTDVAFLGLSSSTSYTLIQRVKETSDTYASPNSEALVVVTGPRPSSHHHTSASDSNQTKDDEQFEKAIQEASTNEKGMRIVAFEKDADSNGVAKIELPSNMTGKNVIATIKTGKVEVTMDGRMFASNKKIELEIKRVEKEKLKLEENAQNLIGNNPVYDISVFENGKMVAFTSEQPMNVRFNLDAKEKNNHLFVAIYIDDNGAVHLLKDSLFDGTKLSFRTNHLSNYGVIYLPTTYEDIDQHWGKVAVEALAAREIIKGRSEAQFAPDAEITRAEFVALMVRYFDLKNDSKERYSDIDDGAWYAESVAIAKENQILPERYGEHIQPNKAITREEVMDILYRAILLSGITIDETGATLEQFIDRENLAEDTALAAEYLVKREIIRGYAGKINPEGKCTRAEVAEILYRLLQTEWR
jgi:flagella basal body P-ring formation protein FlgA